MGLKKAEKAEKAERQNAESVKNDFAIPYL